MDKVELTTILGVLAVLLGGIAYNALVAARARARAARSLPTTGWVGKHVQHDGRVVGEVVADEGDTLVLRKGEAMLCVPRAVVHPQGLDLGIKGSFDEATALAEGAAWKLRHGVLP